MIDLYTWGTPNGRKVSIMLEECRLPYRTHSINIGQNEQFTPAFLAVNPNGKIPAIVDPDGPDGQPISMFESGAMLVYLSGKTGKFLPQSVRGKYDALQWLMFQMGGVGPMFGQTHHFMRAAPEKIEYGIKRYQRDAAALRRARQAPRHRAIPGGWRIQHCRYCHLPVDCAPRVASGGPERVSPCEALV